MWISAQICQAGSGEGSRWHTRIESMHFKEVKMTSEVAASSTQGIKLFWSMTPFVTGNHVWKCVKLKWQRRRIDDDDDDDDG